jgi:carbamoyltransferase
MRILGISAYYHDSAAAIIEDGLIVAAMEEERFSRVKHDRAFPQKAIEACLTKTGVQMHEIDAVAYYEKPLKKFERVLEMCAATYPYSLRTFVAHMPEWLTKKITIEQQVRDLGFAGKMHFIPHHLSHAAFAFYPSPYEEAAILTVDGVGEYETTALWRGSGTRITEIASLHFPHSLGLLYSTLTAFLGFRVNDDEYKVMGLAGHGKPTFDTELSRLVTLHDDGSFALNLEYFAFRESFQMWSPRLEALLGPPRNPGEEITGRHRDIAASLQSLTEEIYMRLLRRLCEVTGITDVCISGGVAQNATANGKIFSQTPFTDAFIPGAAGDDGAAAGAALYAYHAIAGNTGRAPLGSLALGTTYDADAIEWELTSRSLSFTRHTEEELVHVAAQMLKEGTVLGWYQGAMEFGPRALGQRSIIADPRRPEMRERLNRIKDRHDFHPFAGSILAERARDYFDMPDVQSPFMTACFPMRAEKRAELAAITHADGTCRIQTVSSATPRWHALISEFGRQTGTPCILNTSFNGKGEPIVEKPSQAIADFQSMHLDALIIGDYLVRS